MNAQNGEHPELSGDRTGLTDNSILLPELSDRRDLDDWLSDLLNSKREVKGYKSESDCGDDNPDEDCSQSDGEAALNNAGSALNNASELVPALNNAEAALNNARITLAGCRASL